MSNREYICGINSVREAVSSARRQVYEIYIIEGNKNQLIAKIASDAEKKGIRVKEAPRQKIHDLTKVETNQGIAAEVESFKYLTIEELLSVIKKTGKPPFIIILDQVSDPHNLGAIIRTAHLLGADGIIIPKDNSASVNPTVSKAASGALEYIPIVKVTNLTYSINLLKNNNIWVVGAEGESSKSLYEYDFTTGTAIVLGGEGKGLRRLIKESCDELLRIPMAGRLDSFNVSVAGAIFMSEVMRQRLCKNRADSSKKT